MRLILHVLRYIAGLSTQRLSVTWIHRMIYICSASENHFTKQQTDWVSKVRWCVMTTSSFGNAFRGTGSRKGIHLSQVDSPIGDFFDVSIKVRNSWRNNWSAGNLKRHDAHVTVTNPTKFFITTGIAVLSWFVDGLRQMFSCESILISNVMRIRDVVPLCHRWFWPGVTKRWLVIKKAS